MRPGRRRWRTSLCVVDDFNAGLEIHRLGINTNPGGIDIQKESTL